MSPDKICDPCVVVFLCGNLALSQIFDTARLLHYVENRMLCIGFFLTGGSRWRSRRIQLQGCGGQHLRSRSFPDSSFKMSFWSATLAACVTDYATLLLSCSALLAIGNQANEHSSTIVASSKFLVRYPCVGVEVTAVLTNTSLYCSLTNFSYFVPWAERYVQLSYVDYAHSPNG